MNAELRLRDLPFAARLGFSGAILSLLLGVWASIAHIEDHHQNRDGRPGVSLDDLKGAYHGIDAPSPLVEALESGHPPALAAEDRALLLKWLKSEKQGENFDNPDLGAAAPAEILQRRCLACHARKSTEGGGIGQKLPLEYWDDVQKLVFARHIDATPKEILITSTHTHALSLAGLTLVMSLLVLCTRFPSAGKSAIVLCGGLGLSTDLAGWWLARAEGNLVWLVIAGGACWSLATIAGALIVLAELWLPKSRA